jgi:hypothetical protein
MKRMNADKKRIKWLEIFKIPTLGLSHQISTNGNSKENSLNQFPSSLPILIILVCIMG